MKKFLLFIVFIISANCIGQHQINFPEIITSSYQSLSYNNVKQMTYTSPIVYALDISEKDFIDLRRVRGYSRHNYTRNHYYERIIKDSLLVHVDTRNLNFHSEKSSIYHYLDYQPTYSKSKIKKVDSLHLELLSQIKKHHIQMIPVYIYNPNKHGLIIGRALGGGDLYMIIEAKDKQGIWRPIEYFRQYDFICGTGHKNYVLKPKKMIVVGMKKYQGNFKTKARVKFLNFNKKYYSNEFEMSINESQFNQRRVFDSISKELKIKKGKYLRKRLFLN